MDLEGIASLRMWIVELGMNYRSDDPLIVRDAIRALREELAQRLIQLAAEAAEDETRAGFLIRGFRLETDFAGTWHPEFLEFELDSGQIAFGLGSLVLNIESAFRTLVRVGDYVAADSVARKCPEAFMSFGLRGWRAAVAGFLNPEQAVERFSEAADEFARDTHDEERFKVTGSWSSINVDLGQSIFVPGLVWLRLSVRQKGQLSYFEPRATCSKARSLAGSIRKSAASESSSTHLTKSSAGIWIRRRLRK